MRAAEILCAVGVLAGAGLLLREALRLDVGWGDAGPGAGFFPFWLGMGLLLSSLPVLLQAVRSPAADARPFLARGALISVSKVLGPIVGVIAAMDLVGFYLAAAVYLAVSGYWLHRHRWPLVLGLCVAFPLVTWLVFERWFLILLPKGRLGPHWPF